MTKAQRLLRGVACCTMPLLLGLTSGCSKIRSVFVVNRFPTKVVIKIDGYRTSPAIPANGHAYLDRRQYIGSSARITMETPSGKFLAEKILSPKEVQANRFNDDLDIVDVGP